MDVVADENLKPVAEKVGCGERLDWADGLLLARSRDIHGIGRLADMVHRGRHDGEVYYNLNRHINYTNYCILRCKFCPFWRRYGDGASGGYELTVKEVAEQARQAYEVGATEVHIVGGLHPKLPFDFYVEMCRAVRSACPRIHIKAFTAIEIIHFARMARPRLSVRDVLGRLREAGLDSLPGGGAEIFDQRVHDEAYRHKVGPQGWFDVHRTAHEMGICSNATMLFGHIEAAEQRVQHLLALREQQDESLARGAGRFNCIVPLPFVPDGSELSHLPGPTGLDSLRTIALCRLMLDNFDHVKAFWVMLSPKLAQVALSWGADDLDGTVQRYQIVQATERAGDVVLTVDQLRRLIVEAGFEPRERDSLYRPIVRNGAGPQWRVSDSVHP